MTRVIPIATKEELLETCSTNMGTTLKGCGSCFLFIITTVVVYKLSLPIFLENFDPEKETPSDDRMVPKMKRTYSGRHLICHHFRGGMADQLFQYASLLGIAARQNRIVVSNKGDSELENYLVNVKINPGAAHCNGIGKLSESSCCHFDEALVKLDQEKNYEIEGLLKSWHYFKDREDMIRKAIVFQSSVIRKAKNVLEKALTSRNVSLTKSTLVGIHVRRGERLKNRALNKGYKVATKEYFQQAMDYFRKRVKNHLIFVVVSQDQTWSRRNLLGSKDVVDVPTHESHVDMALLTLLDHNIVSVGTFSWWVAFLTKGAVVYYKHPFIKESMMMGDYGGTLKDYFLPSWIGME